MTYKSLIVFGLLVVLGSLASAVKAEGREVNRAYEYKVTKSVEVVNQHLVDSSPQQPQVQAETLNLPNLSNVVQQQQQPGQQPQRADLSNQQHFNYPPPFYYQPPPRKHYKITVIRGPARPTTPPTAAPEIEEKTLIYVLVKKPDEPSAIEVEAQIQQTQKQGFKLNKPEVYFVKYNTKKENEAQTDKGYLK